MKKILTCLSAFMAIALYMTNEAYAQVGNPYIHDPSTIVECDGKYYTFGTGGGGLISEDGWTWEETDGYTPSGPECLPPQGYRVFHGLGRTALRRFSRGP